MSAEREAEQAMVVRVAADVAEHEMTVLHDDGLYRHLRFKKPGTGMYWYDLITWPGTLTIRGDMGTFVFARSQDMLAFFRGQHVNPSYWGEKEQSGTALKHWDGDRAARTVREHLQDALDGYLPPEKTRITRRVEGVIRSEDWERRDSAIEALMDLDVDLTDLTGNPRAFRLYEPYDWGLEVWTAQYLWSITALPWAIDLYDKSKITDREQQ